MEELDKLMSNFSRSTLLLACLGIVISMAAACVPVATPTPAGCRDPGQYDHQYPLAMDERQQSNHRRNDQGA